MELLGKKHKEGCCVWERSDDRGQKGQQGRQESAYHDVEIPLLALVVHLWKAIHFSKIPVLQQSTRSDLH